MTENKLKSRLLAAGMLSALYLSGCAMSARNTVTPESLPASDTLYRAWTADKQPPDLFARNLLGSYRKEYNGLFREEDMASAPILPDPLPLQTDSFAIPVTVDYSHDELQFGYTIPVVINDRVNQYINFYSVRYKQGFQNQLQRANYYLPMIREIFREEGVPEDLAYVALVESGFRPTARSHAGAVGIWQFIRPTGQRYGLEVNWWLDERRDPIKSTRAAARYLNDLYGIFGDWHLALAGYNCGENRVLREMRNSGADSFWELSRLPRETREYVPAILAAIVLANNTEKYSIVVPPNEEIYNPDLVPISHPTSLNVIANITGISIDRIKALNPELNGYVTPPSSSYRLKLFPGYGAPVETALREIPKGQRVSWIKHQVRSGESLYVLSRRYNISIEEIRRANQLSGNLLRVNQVLLIPSLQHPPSSSSERMIAGVIQHRVSPGESLSVISERYRVSMNEIRRNNNISGDTIRAGQTLLIPVGEPLTSATTASASSPGGMLRHVVRNGESLSTISSRYNVTIAQLRQANNIRGDIIQAGQTLNIPAAQRTITQSQNTRMVRHEVRAGESLSVLSDRYNTPIVEIRRANNLRGDLLRVGQVLQVPVRQQASTPAGGQQIAGGIQHRVREGESLSVLSDRYNVPIRDIRQANGLRGDLLRAGQVLIIPNRSSASNIVDYEVRNGDSLSVIAQNFDTTVAQLVRLNNLEHPEMIRPGQVLRIAR